MSRKYVDLSEANYVEITIYDDRVYVHTAKESKPN
jgi:hypothetical protein